MSGEEPRQTIAEEWHQEKQFPVKENPLLKKLDEIGRIEKLPEIKQRFECARASCPWCENGQSCKFPSLWHTCLRQKEP